MFTTKNSNVLQLFFLGAFKIWAYTRAKGEIYKNDISRGRRKIEYSNQLIQVTQNVKPGLFWKMEETDIDFATISIHWFWGNKYR